MVEQLWLASPPLPAAHQRPLFDAERQGAIVLHQLELLPALSALPQLVTALLDGLRALLHASPSLPQAARPLLRELAPPPFNAPPEAWRELIPTLDAIERRLCLSASFFSKLPEGHGLEGVLEGKEVIVSSEARRQLEGKLLSAATRRSVWGSSREPEVHVP